MNTLLVKAYTPAKAGFLQRVRGVCTGRTSGRNKTSTIGPIHGHRRSVSSFNKNTSNSSNAPPPPPPSNNTTLPTLDVSPILDPTLYIKKSSKSIHTNCGSEATKRLLKAQHRIRSWIWDHETPEASDEQDQEDGDHGVTNPCGKSLCFGLVGHGVPFQLLQDHVDCGWGLLEQNRDLNSDDNFSSNNEVVECCFQNDSGELNMDWMRNRNRDREKSTIPFPPPHFIDTNLLNQIDLYLTVMNRITRTFGTILQTAPNGNDPTLRQITNTKYWQNDKPVPIKYWKTEVRRGFVYPPSATIFSTAFLDEDYWNHGHELGNRRRRWGMGNGGEWTNPPIVELIAGSNLQPESDNSNDEEDSNEYKTSSNCRRAPSFVRITIQGIPSSFWNEDLSSWSGEKSEATNANDRNGRDNKKDDMVPVSLVFEACFQDEGEQ